MKLARSIRHIVVKMLSGIKICYYRLMGIKIGKECYISVHANIDVRRGEIIIGNNVNISNGSYVLGHVGHEPLEEGGVTIIEDNVRIFVNAVILPAIKIGKNSVVGAGSVVMKDVPPDVVVMGNPARVVRHLET